MRVLHLITGLGLGGAEIMLLKLLRASDREANEHVVLTLTSVTTLQPAMEALGVRVRSLDIRGAVGGFHALWQARAFIRDFRPKVVMTWLHHADLFGAMLKCLKPSLRLVWNLRCSQLSASELSRGNILLVRLLARLSFLPSAVVANAHAGRAAHAAEGYRPRRWAVLPNGFDTAAFAPDVGARAALRGNLGLAGDAFLVGIVGRYHPMKDFGLFVAAAGRFARGDDKVRFVMAGKDVTGDNAELVAMIRSAGIESQTVLLGPRQDVAAIMNSLDVLANTSTSEGFPNVIGEAMACGTPCVATDVGDSADIVGDSGIVIPPGDVDALVTAWQKMRRMPADEFLALKQRARQRILDHYEIGVVARRYQELFNEFA